MTIRNRLKKSLPNTGKHFLLSGIALAVLSACGGTGQDDGRVSATSQQFSGQAVDGYLARAIPLKRKCFPVFGSDFFCRLRIVILRSMI